MRRIIAIVLLTAATQAVAQRAVLYSGPDPGRGLLFLPVNVIPYYQGVYTIENERVRVIYTGSRIVTYDSWEPSTCGTYRLLEVAATEERTTFYADLDAGWHLFVEVDTGSPTFCAFIDEFLRRFRYFLEVGEEGGPPPFPAILALD